VDTGGLRQEPAATPDRLHPIPARAAVRRRHSQQRNEMKSLPAIVLVVGLLSATAPAPAKASDYYPELVTLIAELANLDALAQHCEEDMMNFGKDALRKDMCANFVSHYGELWPNQDALSNQILDFAKRSERGEITCDDTCRSMLRRCEELRITISYVFDYIDYVKTQ
jgi:hypothetical protein